MKIDESTEGEDRNGKEGKRRRGGRRVKKRNGGKEEGTSS